MEHSGVGCPSGHIKLLMPAVSRVIVLNTEKIIIEEYENPSWLKLQKTEFPRIFPNCPYRVSVVNHRRFGLTETKTAFIFTIFFATGF